MIPVTGQIHRDLILSTLRRNCGRRVQIDELAAVLKISERGVRKLIEEMRRDHYPIDRDHGYKLATIEEYEGKLHEFTARIFAMLKTRRAMRITIARMKLIEQPPPIDDDGQTRLNL